MVFTYFYYLQYWFYDFSVFFTRKFGMQVFNDQHGYKLNILSAGGRES